MSLMGVARGGHHASGPRGHAGHAHSPVGHGRIHVHQHASGRGVGRHVGSAKAHTHGHQAQRNNQAEESSAPWFFVSPLAIFSVCLGAGATGMLIQGHLAPSFVAVLAAVAGILFNAWVVNPVSNALLSFAARPSEGLEGSVAHTATAITSFDEQGKGLVSLTVDGQTVQVLARLDPAEVGLECVHKGDELVVLDVDSKRNTCRVTKELSWEPKEN